MCIQHAVFSFLRQEFRISFVVPYFIDLVLLLVLSKLMAQKVLPGQSQLWQYLCTTFPWLWVLRSAGQLVLCVALVYGSVFVSGLVWRYGGTDSAYFASACRQMELAERIFQLTNGTGERSFAVESGIGYRPRPGQTQLSFESENIELDTIVARVYGSQSRTMANRYLCHAYRAECAFENYKLAASYFKSALAIYRIYDDPEQCLEILQFLAYAQGENGEFAELRENLRTSLKMLFQANLSASAKTSFSLVTYYADEFGIDVSRENLLLSSLPRSATTHTKDTDYSFLDYTIFSILLLIPFIRPLRSRFFKRARFKWELALTQSDSMLSSIEQLDRLIVLELFLGNLTKADEYSRKSLELATSWKT
jgi:tetratricopeptide (TPR) repeat protein